MPLAELPEPILANLTTLPDLDRSLSEKGTANPGDGLYPRDGVPSVAVIEGQISGVTTPGQHNVIVWASGMSAVRETVKFATSLTGEQRRSLGYSPIDRDPVVAYATALYGQTTTFFKKEGKSGVEIVSFNSGSEEDVSALDADVIFAETVANTPEMPVLDIHRLLESIRYVKSSGNQPPILVLDNSLPLSTGINFADLLRPDDPVIIVESGTKNLMNNSGSLGVSHSPNTGLIEALRRHKANSGAIISIEALQPISDKLRLTIPGFHDRNRRVFSSTGKIALALAEAQAELGTQAAFSTTFPTNPTHPNYEYARQITPEGLICISPAVFISGGFYEDAGRDLALRLYGHPRMREQIDEGQIHFGQSFGTPRARMLYDPDTTYVRFAGGYDLADEDALASAIKEAATDLVTK